MKAILYLRVSTEEQANHGVSLAAQENKLRAYCELQGIEIADVVREEGISAAKPLATRPGGEQLLRSIAKGEAQHVVALKLDRLFRDAEDALHTTKAWDAAGVALHLVDMGGQTINTGTAMGRFFLGMMAGFAELERNLIAERTKTAMTHKKENGQAYAPTPYGYDREGDNLQTNDQEQATVKRIKALKEAGATLREIASALNDEGVPTKRGGKWHASTVRYILKNSLYGEVA